MLKDKILEMYDKPTGITYKHQPLFVGDVYKNELGTIGIVLFENEKYLYKKTNMCEHVLPEDKAGMCNSEFVANVVQDEQLMQQFVDCGIIKLEKEDKKVTEEKPKKTKEDKKVTLNIYQKINEIRKAWSETDMEKEGKGKLGGAGKFNYYKPQQIIDFCLAQELKHNLYSKFSIVDDRCFYELINLDNIEETETVACPFEIPRKMVVNEAQQAGAALTYFNRRLAMMMYKIEDNSKESVDVLADVANAKDEINAPEIPAPPIMPTAPVSVQVNVPTAPVSDQVSVPVPPIAPAPVPSVQNVQPEPPSKLVGESKTVDVQTVVNEVKGTVINPLPWENDDKVQTVTSTPPIQTPPPAPKMGSIESLY